MPDYKDWLEVAAKKRRGEIGTQRPALERVAKAAVATESLLSDPIWHVYQQALQAKLEDARAKLDAHHRDLEEGLNLDPTALVGLKFDVAIAKARIDLLREVMELPHKIIEEGKRARHDLAGLDTPA